MYVELLWQHVEYLYTYVTYIQVYVYIYIPMILPTSELATEMVVTLSSLLWQLRELLWLSTGLPILDFRSCDENPHPPPPPPPPPPPENLLPTHNRHIDYDERDIGSSVCVCRKSEIYKYYSSVYMYMYSIHVYNMKVYVLYVELTCVFKVIKGSSPPFPVPASAPASDLPPSSLLPSRPVSTTATTAHTHRLWEHHTMTHITSLLIRINISNTTNC